MRSEASEESSRRSSRSTSSLQVVALGEVLWDIYNHTRTLGGAPLNFGAHLCRLGHGVTLISAVGQDEAGQQAKEIIAPFGLDLRFLQTTSAFPTGTAAVRTGPDGAPQFTIVRPAAYDAVDLTADDLGTLQQLNPNWLYYGTLFASTDAGKEVLLRLLTTLEDAFTFYDLNLRPGHDSPALVRQLLLHADVVKMNEEEWIRVAELAELSVEIESFCREGARRFGWHAVGITLGNQGCAILSNGQFAQAKGHAVDVVDTVGAGDAFSAAFLHGLSLGWPALEIATFSNRVGALVASRHGAIPEWTLEEAVQP